MTAVWIIGGYLVGGFVVFVFLLWVGVVLIDWRDERKDKKALKKFNARIQRELIEKETW